MGNEKRHKNVELSHHHQYMPTNTKSSEFCDSKKKPEKPETLSEKSVSEISESTKDKDSMASDTEQGSIIIRFLLHVGYTNANSV